MKKNCPEIDIAATGRNIKRIMRRKGLTVKDVQTFLGLGSPHGIYHWFEGRNLPTVDNLYALSNLFHLPVDAILKGSREYEYRTLEGTVYQRGLVYYEKFRKRPDTQCECTIESV